MPQLIVKLKMPTSTQSKPRQELPIDAKDVPRVRVLAELLGYERKGFRRDINFHEHARAYPACYTTEHGLPGNRLTRWGDEDVKRALIKMTTDFLSCDGSGFVYWPDNPTSDFYGRLQYSEHKAVITNLCVQFFFRINQQPLSLRVKRKLALHKAASDRGVPPLEKEASSNLSLREPAATNQLGLASPPRPSSPSRSAPRAFPLECKSTALSQGSERWRAGQLEMSGALPSPRSSVSDGRSRAQRHCYTDPTYQPGSSSRAPSQYARLTRARTSFMQTGNTDGDRALTLEPERRSTWSAHVRQDISRQRHNREESHIMGTVESDLPRASSTRTVRAPIARMNPPGNDGSVKPSFPLRESSQLPELPPDGQRRNEPVFSATNTGFKQSSRGQEVSSPTYGISRPLRNTSNSGQTLPRDVSAPPDYKYRFLVNVSSGITRSWDMPGSFEDKCLETLVAEMKSSFNLADNDNTLFVTLLTPHESFFDDISLDDEAKFESTKQIFRILILDTLKKSPESPRGACVTFVVRLQLGSFNNLGGETATTV